MITKSRVYKQTRRRISVVLKSFLYAGLLEVVSILLFYFIGAHLIDWSLLVTMWVAEVPIGFVLYYLLGEGQSKKFDVLQEFEAKAKYSHLEIHRANNWIDSDYPDLLYYIVNKRTKKAYWVSNLIRNSLVITRIIRGTHKVTREELFKYFKENNIIVENRYPELRELLIEDDR